MGGALSGVLGRYVCVMFSMLTLFVLIAMRQIASVLSIDFPLKVRLFGSDTTISIAVPSPAKRVSSRSS